MADIFVRFVAPTPGPRQAPIQNVRIDHRVSETFDWAEAALLDPEVGEARFPDAAPGTHYYRGVVIDTVGQEDENPLETSVDVSFDPPSSLESLTATLE